jgi:Outer membrane lipoprotein-sorting protein
MSIAMSQQVYQAPSGAACPAHVTGLLHLFLLLLLVSSSVCFGQRATDPRPAPLDPVQAEEEARALVAEMLAARPEQNVTNTGWVTITDADGKERKIPVRFEIASTPTNWVSVYETLPSAGGRGGMKLTVIHSGEQPNRYELFDPATSGATNTVAKVLTPAQIMMPFAGSDFWIADLGLEFLHWPKQRLRERNVISHHKASRKLESINPSPVPGGYARVVSWIMIESPHGITHADAYDIHDNVLKRFDPTNLEKIQGEYQLEEIEMRNPNTESRTVIKFNLAHK